MRAGDAHCNAGQAAVGWRTCNARFMRALRFCCVGWLLAEASPAAGGTLKKRWARINDSLETMSSSLKYPAAC